MPPPLPLEPYQLQEFRWPSEGRHILAHHDAETVVVYQTYRPSIADYALEHGRFGGGFSFGRMSWVKPNFLWMMYRCGWASKPDQERVLGLRLSRAFFDQLLAQAVLSHYVPGHYPDQEAWKQAVARSEVRLQWDPDHLPNGHPCQRRALQLGLRGEALRAFGGPELLEVLDMTPLVLEQRAHALSWKSEGKLQTPVEEVYWPALEGAARQVGLDPTPVQA